MPQDISLSISEKFKLAFSRQPLKVAMKSGRRSYTFQELDQISARYGKYMFERLGNAETPIVIFLQDPIDIVAALIGAMRSGYSYSVLTEKNPPAQLTFTLVDLEAKLVLTDSALLPVIRLAAPAGCVIVNIADIPAYEGEVFYRQAPLNDCVGIYYTSGSTGQPKGVMRLHTAMILRSLAEIVLEKVTPEDVHCLTMSFSGGASLNIFMAFFSGATCVLYEIDKHGFSELKRVLQDEKVTVFRCSVQPFRYFLASLSDDDFFPDLRLFMPTGDAFYRSDVEGLRKRMPRSAVIIDGLSASEIGNMTRHVIRHDTPLDSNKLLVGYPWENKEILLLDENGNHVPKGEIGEIVMRSNQPFHGYWRKPELTAEKLMPDPADPSRTIFRSGDLGRFHPDGQLEHIGRKDFRVKIRGFSVDLSAIENILMSHPNVQRAVFIAVEDLAAQKRLVAYVLPMKDTQITTRELLEFVSSNLPSYMVPALIMMVSEFPLGVTGKVNRADLPTPLWDEVTAHAAYKAPVDTFEAKLAIAWKKTLGVRTVGTEDNFFELGGDSLKALELFEAIEQEFSQKIPFALISSASTIKRQAEILRSPGAYVTAPVLIPMQINGDKKPIYCIGGGGGGGDPIRFNFLLKYLATDQPVYFLQLNSLIPGDVIETSVESIAREYLMEVKKSQPEGPYHFLGFSSGGSVAYEMAQQLVNQGECVAFLGLLDPLLPDMKREKGISPLKYLILLREHAQFLRRSGMTDAVALLQYYLNWLKFKNNIVSYEQKIDRKLAQRKLGFGEEEKKSNSTVSTAYRPKPYPGRVVLFNATMRLVGYNSDQGWMAVGIGDLIIYSFDCTHVNLLYEPFVQQVAEKISLYLDAPVSK